MSYLKGQAVILPGQHAKQGHIIRWLHPFYSDALKACMNSPDARLAALFGVKEKWTKGELEAFLEPYLDVKIDAYLMKNTRMIKDRNPFDPQAEVMLYLKKF